MRRAARQSQPRDLAARDGPRCDRGAWTQQPRDYAKFIFRSKNRKTDGEAAVQAVVAVIDLLVHLLLAALAGALLGFLLDVAIKSICPLLRFVETVKVVWFDVK